MSSTTNPNAHLLHYEHAQAPMVTNATIPLIGKGQNMDRQGTYNNQQIIDRIINQQNMQQ